MPIIRRSEQKRKTLEGFYKDFIPKPENTLGDVGTPMLEILEFLNLSFKNTIIYGSTSHAQLLLFNSDKSDDYYVSIVGYTYKYDNEFVVEYVIPSDKSPWEGAIVRGVTRQFEDLKKMIIISMTESGGLKDNPELEDRFKNYRS